MTGKRVIRIRATVQDDGRIAIDVPAVAAGADVEVLLILPGRDEATKQAYWPPPVPAPRPSQSAADVELFLEAERAAWEH
jgi:hypothetical protein